MAHVFAANDSGPRAKSDLSKKERGSFENLIMLCANCHTMVDKAPDAFPVKMMLSWKREHANKLQGLFGAVRLGDRASARQVVEPLLAENHAIFKQYGPHIDAARNPESGAAEQWRRKMLTRILPNSRRMLAILDANRHLLGGNERATLEQFRQHIDDLEAFHIEGNREDASRFPGELPKILED
ncbi:HNH endonuclease family protein [Azotobacter chroococcum NCIMB 8003]|uniref:HNH endonuclease family protein n=2 Tax=Azotobacter chroococcum TaxID=353 RepID=A0A0C4WHQ9_9GAMM|nr:HNH endonuclease family protein [Azotobacter chroococcum NCIMB 8003]